METPELPTKEGFLGILVCAADADKRLDGSEVVTMVDAVRRLRLFEADEDVDIRELVDKVRADARYMGADAYLAACVRSLPLHLREDAFGVATDILLADRGYSEAEDAYLARLQNRLAIPDGMAHRIVDAKAQKIGFR